VIDIRSHDEGLDGSSYPRGLKGDAISLPARIIAVADVNGARVE
jgi:HD-GYP domain-containing protein (c-di-GMP phosphodiesterase class II)